MMVIAIAIINHHLNLAYDRRKCIKTNLAHRFVLAEPAVNFNFNAL